MRSRRSKHPWAFRERTAPSVPRSAAAEVASLSSWGGDASVRTGVTTRGFVGGRGSGMLDGLRDSVARPRPAPGAGGSAPGPLRAYNSQRGGDEILVTTRDSRRLLVCVALAIVALAPLDAQPAAPARPETPADTLGRDTPKGAVLGFLLAGRRNDTPLARQYLN